MLGLNLIYSATFVLHVSVLLLTCMQIYLSQTPLARPSDHGRSQVRFGHELDASLFNSRERQEGESQYTAVSMLDRANSPFDRRPLGGKAFVCQSSRSFRAI
jgi:hypothetical protein